MAWTQADLDTIEAAIANPEMRVRFADGREVQYRSVSEILTARDVIKAALHPAAVRCTYAQFSKG